MAWAQSHTTQSLMHSDSGAQFRNFPVLVTECQEGGALAFLQSDATWRSVFQPGKMGSMGSVGKGCTTGTLLAVPSALSPEPHNPVSLLKLQFAPSCPTSPGYQDEWL